MKNEIISEEILNSIKKELIDAYHRNGYKNCIGSVESVLEELFNLRMKEIQKSSNNLKQKLVDNWNKVRKNSTDSVENQKFN